jgi:hypothetical protein
VTAALMFGAQVPATPVSLTWMSALSPYICLTWVYLTFMNLKIPSNLTSYQREFLEKFIKFNIALLALVLALIVFFYVKLFELFEKRPKWAQ